MEYNPSPTELAVGDAVFVKPAPPFSCISQWKRGTVRGTQSVHQVEVDGRPYHVSHVRHAPSGSARFRSDHEVRENVEMRSAHRDGLRVDESEPVHESGPTGEPAGERSSRAIRRPARFEDFVCAGATACEGDKIPPCSSGVCLCALRARGHVV